MKTYTYQSAGRGAFRINELIRVQAENCEEAEKQVDRKYFRLLTITK